MFPHVSVCFRMLLHILHISACFRMLPHASACFRMLPHVSTICCSARDRGRRTSRFAKNGVRWGFCSGSVRMGWDSPAPSLKRRPLKWLHSRHRHASWPPTCAPRPPPCALWPPPFARHHVRHGRHHPRHCRHHARHDHDHVCPGRHNVRHGRCHVC